MATILITGGTGLIGQALSELLLQKGYEIIILTHKKKISSLSPRPGISYARWDIKDGTVDLVAVEKADYIIHLAGASVAGKRWTTRRKKEIVDSRVKTAGLLVKALSENRHSVKAVIAASAIGYYGPDPDIPNTKPFIETDPPNTDFLGSTCQEWENSVLPFEKMGIRVVRLRTGIVLSEKGGALREFIRPIRFGFATIFGRGKQMVSWIYIGDLVRIYHQAIEDEQMSGAYNAVSPRPVSNKELILALARKIKGQFFVPIYIPGFILKIILGEMSIEIMKSATVSAEKIQSAGFRFICPTLDAALEHLFSPKK